MLQIDINFPNPLDLLTQALEGNWVAWFGIAIFIVAFAMFVFLVILWLKLPEYAKKGFINNLIGHRPVVLECYENRKVKFLTPYISRNGLAYDKGAVFISPRLWVVNEEGLSEAEKLKELGEVEMQALNSVYSGDGCPAGLYLNYSIQASISNPELLVVMQHEREIQKLAKTDSVSISIDVFASALEFLKSKGEKMIQLHPMNLNLPLDIRQLKTILQRSDSKGDIIEHEHKVRMDERGGRAGMGGSNTIVLLLLVISIILGVVGLLKQFGLF